MKARLTQLKDELMLIREHKNRIRVVPELEIVDIFQKQHQIKEQIKRIQQNDRQMHTLNKSITALAADIQRESNAYEQHSEALKDKFYILKAFVKTLQAQYDEVKELFAKAEFTKTITAAVRRCYLYRLAQIFFNDSSKHLFSQCIPRLRIRLTDMKFPYNELTTEQMSQHFSVGLSYIGFVLDMMSRIINVRLLNTFVFKGSRSYITSADRFDSSPLYLIKTSDRKSFENGLRYCMNNAFQLLDIIGVDRKVKKDLDMATVYDIISQYIITTEVDMVKIPG